MEDCNLTGCKEIERIETLVTETKQIVYSMCDEFRNIIVNKIYCPTTKKELSVNVPAEPEPSNKFDRIILDLHRVINTVRDFKKKELAELELELSKL